MGQTNTCKDQARAKMGVIFDCDGTLVDSMAAWRHVEESIANMAGITLAKEDTDALTTMSIPECGEFLHGKFGVGESGADVEDIINTMMLEFYRTKAVPKPGALEFVKGLADAGIPMCVASSTPNEPLDAGIENAGFAPYMQAVLSVDNVGHSKREPHLYLRCCEIMGTEPASTWVCEDAAYALDTANAAGFRTLGIFDCDLSATWEQILERADLPIRSFEDITAAEFLKR